LMNLIKGLFGAFRNTGAHVPKIMINGREWIGRVLAIRQNRKAINQSSANISIAVRFRLCGWGRCAIVQNAKGVVLT
jgi:hypothetical protein